MASKKPYTVENATKNLEPLSKKAPDYSENLRIYEVLERTPPGVSMELVTRVLRQQVKKSGSIDSSATTRMSPAFVEAVAPIYRENPKDPIAAFMLAALPSKVAEWEPVYEEALKAFEVLDYLGLTRYRKSRERILGPLAKKPHIVAAAQAVVALTGPDTSSGSLLLLALEGSPESMDVAMQPVMPLLENKADLDWLTNDFSVLLQAPAALALKQIIVSKTRKQNAGSPALIAGHALGLPADKDAFRFKFALYDGPGYRKARVSIDSTKDPWCSGIWNFNEMLSFPLVKKSDPPMKQLESVFKSVMTEAKWERYEFSSPHTGPFKKALAAWVAKQLPGVTLGR
jgi:hypothetical protein